MEVSPILTPFAFSSKIKRKLKKLLQTETGFNQYHDCKYPAKGDMHIFSKQEQR